jgi:hypothetical protein
MLFAAILAGLLAAGCGSSGKSADPPANVVALAGDGIITVTWPMESGVDYWLFFAASPSISTSDWTTIPGSRSVISVASPYVATGLANGTTYSFTLNGRTNGGPGGPGTPSVSAVPRLAGTATASLLAPWTAGAALGTDDLRGVTWANVFVAVGANGALFSSTDGTTWTAVNSGVVANLNAVVFRGTSYLAAGDGGTMLSSTDAKTWTPRNTGTVDNLNAIATNSGLFVAVGANGTIVISADGVTWTAAANSATANNLYAVAAFGNSLWIAVGANGTMITSTDGSIWKSIASDTAFDLKGIAFGTSTATGAVRFVAVGVNGTLVTSPDAVTWTAQPAIGPNTLSAVAYGTQFIAVGAGGSIFTSTDGTTWSGQPSTTSSDLKAIVHAPFSYSVVGAAGVNLLAK